MLEIKTQALRTAVLASYAFDKQHGKLLDSGSSLFTVAGFWHETYAFDNLTRIYYFQGEDLFGYEDA